MHTVPTKSIESPQHDISPDHLLDQHGAIDDVRKGFTTSYYLQMIAQERSRSERRASGSLTWEDEAQDTVAALDNIAK